MLNKVTITIGNDSEVTAEIINGYQINLKFTAPPTIISSDKEICSLQVGKGSLSLFDELTVPIDHKINSVYEVNKIEKLTDRAYSVYTTIGTKTKQFILPCLNFNREYFLYDTFLENVYLKAPTLPIDLKLTKYPLILLYRYSESELYKSFETRIVKHPYFRHRIDVNRYEVVYVFDIGAYESDIKKFIAGKYSTLSPKLKASIMEFHKYAVNGFMWKILNKSPQLREQLEITFNVPINTSLDLYDIPDINQETYKFNPLTNA
jgi:hypothetical protein